LMTASPSPSLEKILHWQRHDHTTAFGTTNSTEYVVNCDGVILVQGVLLTV
jgi:hypothetical protein